MSHSTFKFQLNCGHGRDCKSSSLAFFQILQKVHTRVLTSNPTSKNNEVELIRAGIDKVNGYFKEQPLIATICANADTIGAVFKQVKLKDRKNYLEITYNLAKIHFGLDTSKSFATSLISNPNHFTSWLDYINLVQYLIPVQFIDAFQITRVDLNLDYDCTFEKIVESINIKNKRTSLSFQDRSGFRTGLQIGKGQESIVIYDKALKDKLEYNLSRIELRLSGKMLPATKLNHLISNLTQRTYFSQLEANHLEVHDKALLEEQKNRLNEFSMLARREGFYSARKKFNQNSNFDRDFKGLITLTKWSTQPSEAFRDYILQKLNNQLSTKTIH